MDDATVALLVKCPQCGIESLNEFSVIVVVTALTRWNQMALYSTCHDHSWDASAAEIQAIRDSLGDEWIQENRYLLR